MKPAEQLALEFVESYPREVARLAEHADLKQLAEWLSSLPEEHASNLLRHMLPVAAARALAQLEASQAARLLSQLEPGTAAALLRRLDPEPSKAIQAGLASRFRERILGLLEYREDQAGSRLDPRAAAVFPDTAAAEALERVREAAGSALNYVYVIQADQKLIGVASMSELMSAAPETPLRQLMVESPYAVIADAPLDAVIQHAGWRRAHALPVTDRQGRFLGVFRYSAFRTIETELGRGPDGPDASQTSTALAELFWIGTAAMAKLGGAALLGRPSNKGGRS